MLVSEVLQHRQHFLGALAVEVVGRPVAHQQLRVGDDARTIATR
jgi:hypothetical protein